MTIKNSKGAEIDVEFHPHEGRPDLILEKFKKDQDFDYHIEWYHEKGIFVSKKKKEKMYIRGMTPGH